MCATKNSCITIYVGPKANSHITCVNVGKLGYVGQALAFLSNLAKKVRTLDDRPHLRRNTDRRKLLLQNSLRTSWAWLVKRLGGIAQKL